MKLAFSRWKMSQQYTCTLCTLHHCYTMSMTPQLYPPVREDHFGMQIRQWTQWCMCRHGRLTSLHEHVNLFLTVTLNLISTNIPGVPGKSSKAKIILHLFEHICIRCFVEIHATNRKGSSCWLRETDWSMKQCKTIKNIKAAQTQPNGVSARPRICTQLWDLDMFESKDKCSNSGM